MTYQTIFDYANQTGSTGIAGVVSYASTVSSVLMPLVLFGIFLILMLGSYFAQIRSRGQGDLLGSFAVASIVTAVLSVVLYMVNPPIVNTFTVLVCIVIAIVGVASIFTSSER